MYPFAGSSIASITTFVLVETRYHVESDGDKRKDVRAQDGTEAQWVQRCLVRLEELRADDVRDRVGHKHHCIHHHLLGMTLGKRLAKTVEGQRVPPRSSRTHSSVCSDKTQAHDVGAQVEKGHEQSRQS